MRLLRDDEIHVRPIVAGGLAAVLGEYLGRAVGVAEIRRTPLGKPYLPGAGIEFSVSHTQGWAVVALSTRPVGIDIEAVGPLPELEALAAMSLAPAEARAMARLPVGEREAWYYRCWVRKEALLKARGCGLTLDPRVIDTTRAAGAWHWHGAPLADGVVMAIATAHPHARLLPGI